MAFCNPSARLLTLPTIAAAVSLPVAMLEAQAAETRPSVQVQSAGHDYSYRASGDTHWFEVRNGDGDAAKHTRGVTDRSEVRFIQTGSDTNFAPRNGEEMWFAFSFAVRYDQTPRDWVSIFQFAPTRDEVDRSAKSPALAFELDGRDLKIVTRTDANRVSTRNPGLTRRLRLRNMPVSGLDESPVFHDVVGRVVFGWNNDAEVEIWINGRRVLSQRGVNIGYNDPRGPYPKAGLYRKASPDRLQMILRDPQFSVGQPLLR